MHLQSLTNYLEKHDKVSLTVYSMIAAFGTYTCVYAFRKPVAAATFAGFSFFGVDYKILLITAQVIGYLLSKFIGIKVVSENIGGNRSRIILFLVIIAQAALLLFAVVPKPYNIIFMFLNGIPLGMIWGFVFAYLEGRRTTELLAVGLAATQIFSSGWLRTTGSGIMFYFKVSEMWMPFVTGCIFILPLAVFVFMLKHVPKPSLKDIMMKTERVPMCRDDRRRLIRTYLLGMVLIIIAYMFVLAFRDARDNFMSNLLADIGETAPGNFAMIETWVGVATLAVFFVVYFFKDNFKAFVGITVFIVLGFMIIGASTYAYQLRVITGIQWLIFIGIGLYMAYAPLNTIFFDRLIAALKEKANCGFLIYLADAIGYSASVAVLFVKNFGSPHLDWSEFFIIFSYVVSITGVAFSILYLLYFSRRVRNKGSAPSPQSSPPRGEEVYGSN